MREIGNIIRAEYELGGLSTPVPEFYERLGWERWTGPTFVRTAAGTERTAEDDGGIMILRTPASPPLDVSARITCERRSGDVWESAYPEPSRARPTTSMPRARA